MDEQLPAPLAARAPWAQIDVGGHPAVRIQRLEGAVR
jgi:hypothetical protein